ncbi:hypothetical protein CJU89_5605 [Yarrowia sp. B02]|nr:hypothetical protein CJU89_5605 [Yarrowia sp. B02]
MSYFMIHTLHVISWHSNEHGATTKREQTYHSLRLPTEPGWKTDEDCLRYLKTICSGINVYGNYKLKRQTSPLLYDLEGQLWPEVNERGLLGSASNPVYLIEQTDRCGSGINKRLDTISAQVETLAREVALSNQLMVDLMQKMDPFVLVEGKEEGK